MNVVVVGVGYLGRIHAKIYHEMSNVVLAAVVDTDQLVADQIAKQYNCRAFYHLEDLFHSDTQINAASIVVPTTQHLVVVQPFLERKIPVLLEKPIASTVSESETIVDMANRQEVILQVGHLERFNAGVIKLAKLAQNPRFIEIHRLGEFTGRATDVDVVTDLMIHDIDIVLSLVPAELTRVAATGARVFTEHVDIANARLEFSSGVVANVTASRVSRTRFRRIRVFAENHYLGLNFTDQQLEVISPGEPDTNTGIPKLIERLIPVELQLPLNAELEHFVHCVRQGVPPLVSGKDGLIAVKVADLVKKEISFSMKNRS